MADFRRFYGIDLPDDPHELGITRIWRRYAELYARLPRESIAARNADPDSAWSVEAMLLREVEFRLHNLVWMDSDDGQKRINPPKPIPLPTEQAEMERKRVEAMAAKEQIKDIYNIKE